MSDDRPTIRQIIAKGDSLSEPMSEEESREWYEQTCKENRLERLRKMLELR